MRVGMEMPSADPGEGILGSPTADSYSTLNVSSFGCVRRPSRSSPPADRAGWTRAHLVSHPREPLRISTQLLGFGRRLDKRRRSKRIVKTMLVVKERSAINPHVSLIESPPRNNSGLSGITEG